MSLQRKKIVIDAFQHSPSITGTDRMAYNFLRELQDIDKVNDYVIICSNEPYIQSVISSPNFKIIHPSIIGEGPFVKRAVSKVWREATQLTLCAKKADVYLSFHNMRMPRYRTARRMIAFNLDLIPLKFKDYAQSLGKSQQQLATHYKRVADQADNIVSISKFSKRELIELLGVVEDKVKVIPLAVDPNFGKVNNDKRIINGEYIFTIGGSEPRKNVKTVIEAYQLLPVELQKQYKLVIAGGHWHDLRLDYEKNSNIVEVGYIADEELVSLYANSSVFVFASTYEGFGFTILEAMLAETPVISARGSSLDEVAGNASLSFKATDANEVAQLLYRVLTGSSLQRELIEKGRTQAKKFSWESSAKQLYELLTKE